jgi:hypothetical protein
VRKQNKTKQNKPNQTKPNHNKPNKKIMLKRSNKKRETSKMSVHKNIGNDGKSTLLNHHACKPLANSTASASKVSLSEFCEPLIVLFSSLESDLFIGISLTMSDALKHLAKGKDQAT